MRSESTQCIPAPQWQDADETSDRIFLPARCLHHLGQRRAVGPLLIAITSAGSPICPHPRAGALISEPSQTSLLWEER